MGISGDMLPQSATIKRATVSVVSTGLMVRTWATTVATGVPFSVQPLGEKLAQKVFGRVNAGEAIGYCDYSVSLLTGDQVIVDGVTYEAMAVLDEAGRHHHWAVALSPFKPGAV